MEKTELDKRVRRILDCCDYNDLPFEERKHIGKYMAKQQILTLWQILNRDKELTTAAWRRRQRDWLENCVKSYEKENLHGEA